MVWMNHKGLVVKEVLKCDLLFSGITQQAGFQQQMGQTKINKSVRVCGSRHRPLLVASATFLVETDGKHSQQSLLMKSISEPVGTATLQQTILLCRNMTNKTTHAIIRASLARLTCPQVCDTDSALAYIRCSLISVPSGLAAAYFNGEFEVVGDWATGLENGDTGEQIVHCF